MWNAVDPDHWRGCQWPCFVNQPAWPTQGTLRLPHSLLDGAPAKAFSPPTTWQVFVRMTPQKNLDYFQGMKIERRNVGGNQAELFVNGGRLVFPATRQPVRIANCDDAMLFRDEYAGFLIRAGGLGGFRAVREDLPPPAAQWCAAAPCFEKVKTVVVILREES